jgi:cytochrome c biogenesis protein CcmG, thiol:disulfide interchange protein DsbE
MRSALGLVLCAALLAGCGGGGNKAPTAAQTDQLLDGGKAAFEKRLQQARGKPVVVNKWASWCPPCRSEFPYFARQFKEHRGKVVFLGVDAEDNDSDALDFLAEFPVGFPSFKDPNSQIAASIDAAVSFPTTVFFDSKGKQSYVRQGGYSSEDQLAEDIGRYAR